jgi:hypothetical protein
MECENMATLIATPKRDLWIVVKIHECMGPTPKGCRDAMVDLGNGREAVVRFPLSFMKVLKRMK